MAERQRLTLIIGVNSIKDNNGTHLSVNSSADRSTYVAVQCE